MSIKKEAAKGVFWSAVEKFSAQGIQFLLGIIIARLLLPSDYGMIAMLGIFMAISNDFIDCGFANALIQKRNRTEEDYSTVFYFNIAVAVIIYVALYLISGFVAGFYNEPRLESVMKVVCLSLIINSLGLVQQARLTIALDFRRMASITLTSVVISGIAGMVMAWQGFGVWALVWQSAINNVLRVILMWLSSGWLPTAGFSRESFRGMFSFGSRLLASAMLHNIYTNLYTLIIGKRFDALELGFYNRSFTLAQFPSNNFTNVIVRAVYPIQCRMQDDEAGLKVMFMKYMRIACWLIFPVMMGLCSLAEPVVRIVLTDKWLPMVPYLRVLCVAFMWDPVMRINHNMLNVKGRTDYFLYAEVIKKIIAFGILFATLPYGVMAMCSGLVVYSLADIVVIVYFTRRLTKIGLIEQLCSLAPVIMLSFSMAVIVYKVAALFHSPLVQIAAGAMAGFAYYMSVSMLICRDEFKTIRSALAGKF